MTRSIDERIIDEFAKYLYASQNLRGKPKITRNTLIEDWGMDSLDKAELVMALEDEFIVDIPDASAQSFSSVGDVVDFIKTAPAVVL